MRRQFIPGTAVVVVVGLLAGAASADSRWLVNYDQAMEQSEQTGKPVLAFFTGSDWCGWCMKLNNEVFNTPQFTRWAKDNVILLELDYPQNRVQSSALIEQNKQLARRYGVTGYPTVHILDSTGKSLGKTGYREGGPSPWIANAQQYVDKMPAVVRQELRQAESFSVGMEQARAQRQPMLLIIDDGKQMMNGRRIAALTKEREVIALSQELVLVCVKRTGAGPSEEAQLQQVDQLLAEAAVKPTPVQTLLIDFQTEPATVLFDRSTLMDARHLVPQVRHAMPAPQYSGEWIEDYTAARKIASETGRMLLLDFTGSDWCGWCKKLDEEILSTDAFRQYADENLVLLKVDFPQTVNQTDELKKQNEYLAQQFEVQGYPTLVVLDAEGRQLGRMGYVEGGPEPFLQQLQKMVVH